MLYAIFLFDPVMKLVNVISFWHFKKMYDANVESSAIRQ